MIWRGILLAVVRSWARCPRLPIELLNEGGCCSRRYLSFAVLALSSGKPWPKASKNLTKSPNERKLALPAPVAPDPGAGEARLPVRLDREAGDSDSLAGWLEAYFAVEVTTAESSRAVQRRDLGRFIAFMLAEEGNDQRDRWTSRLSRAFLDALRREVDEEGRRRFSDRTIARITAHLKTFAKWIHSLRPFRLGNPTEKLKTAAHRARASRSSGRSPKGERRKLLDAADHLPVLGGGATTAGDARMSSSPTSGPGGRATAPGATGRSSTP